MQEEEDNFNTYYEDVNYLNQQPHKFLKRSAKQA